MQHVLRDLCKNGTITILDLKTRSLPLGVYTLANQFYVVITRNLAYAKLIKCMGEQAAALAIIGTKILFDASNLLHNGKPTCCSWRLNVALFFFW